MGLDGSMHLLAKFPIVGVLTILKESSEPEDESGHVQVPKVPFNGLGNTNLIINRGGCQLVRPVADTLGQLHVGSQAWKNESAGHRL
jgi:hypothetical protein